MRKLCLGSVLDGLLRLPPLAGFFEPVRSRELGGETIEGGVDHPVVDAFRLLGVEVRRGHRLDTEPISLRRIQARRVSRTWDLRAEVEDELDPRVDVPLIQR